MFRPRQCHFARQVSGATLAAALIAVAGCSASPDVRALSARQVTASEGAVQVEIVLELTNPNDAPLELTEWEYSASVGGRTAYSATWVAALTLPSKVPMTTTLPVVVRGASAEELAGAQWTLGGSVGYRATSQIDRLLYQLGVNRRYAGFGVSGSGFTVPKNAGSVGGDTGGNPGGNAGSGAKSGSAPPSP